MYNIFLNILCYNIKVIIHKKTYYIFKYLVKNYIFKYLVKNYIFKYLVKSLMKCVERYKKKDIIEKSISYKLNNN